MTGLGGLSLAHFRAASAAVGNPIAFVGASYSVLAAWMRLNRRLYQDAAKTTLATSHLDPVRVAVWPFGPNGAVEFAAPSDAARPLLYAEGSGLWSLSFDGVDDRLDAAVAVADGDPWTWGWAGRFNGAQNTRVLQGYGPDTDTINYDTTPGNHVIYRGVVINSGVGPTADPVTILATYGASGNGEIRLNGSPIGTGSVGTRAASTVSIGAGAAGGGSPFSGRINGVFGGVVELTAPQKVQLESTLGDMMGA